MPAPVPGCGSIPGTDCALRPRRRRSRYARLHGTRHPPRPAALGRQPSRSSCQVKYCLKSLCREMGSSFGIFSLPGISESGSHMPLIVSCCHGKKYVRHTRHTFGDQRVCRKLTGAQAFGIEPGERDFSASLVIENQGPLLEAAASTRSSFIRRVTPSSINWALSSSFSTRKPPRSRSIPTQSSASCTVRSRSSCMSPSTRGRAPGGSSLGISAAHSSSFGPRSGNEARSDAASPYSV